VGLRHGGAATLAEAILEDADPETAEATALLTQAIDVRREALAHLDLDLDATVGVDRLPALPVPINGATVNTDQRTGPNASHEYS
jgi:hypothetical protein